MPKFSTPRGTQDILPEDWPAWDFVLHQAREVASLYGYRRLETPTFAETTLFTRTTGAGTDLVDKEMYTFADREGSEMTLRPEGTAPVVRAYLQHGMSKLSQPVRLYYIERIYRYDRPQRGRLREHHQFGCEALGVADAYLDVELVSLLRDFYERIGLAGLSLHVNSIGDHQCRPVYVRSLVSYLNHHIDELAEMDRQRVDRNALRVLDSKERISQTVIESAPSAIDYLCEPCRLHWERFLQGLEYLGIPYQIDTRLVRGLDYYTRTVFEFLPAREGAQSVVGAGGRYDALSEAMGGPPIPGVGFGTGVERLILNIQSAASVPEGVDDIVVTLIHTGDQTETAALQLSHELRRAGIGSLMSYGQRSLNSQMKQANRLGARYALIIAADELKEGSVSVRYLGESVQQKVAREDIVSLLQRHLASSKA